MPEQPGFWSEENFPYMPLLALAQTIPRGYQYQSQLTPYRRSAKGGSQGYFDSTSAPVINMSRIKRGGGMRGGLLGGGAMYG